MPSIRPLYVVCSVSCGFKCLTYVDMEATLSGSGSVWCEKCKGGDSVRFCYTAEVWTQPLTLGLLSTAPPLEWTATVCLKITTHLTGTHTLPLQLVCSRCMYMHWHAWTNADTHKWGLMSRRHPGRVFMHAYLYAWCSLQLTVLSRCFLVSLLSGSNFLQSLCWITLTQSNV